MALGLFRRLLGNRKDIEADAAGVHAVRGQPPSVHAIDVCRKRGVDISSFRSQPLTVTLVDRATHIFAMTGSHLETIHLLFPQSADKTFLLREFEEPGATLWRDLPDPIGMGREVYDECADSIEKALPSVLAFVEETEIAVSRHARRKCDRTIHHGKYASSSRIRSRRQSPRAIVRQRPPQGRSGDLRSHRRGGTAPARKHRAHRVGKFHQPRGDGGARFLSDQQVRRRLSGKTLVWRL